jgi:hypothetical protein
MASMPTLVDTAVVQVMAMLLPTAMADMPLPVMAAKAMVAGLPTLPHHLKMVVMDLSMVLMVVLMAVIIR